MLVQQVAADVRPLRRGNDLGGVLLGVVAAERLLPDRTHALDHRDRAVDDASRPALGGGLRCRHVVTSCSGFDANNGAISVASSMTPNTTAPPVKIDLRLNSVGATTTKWTGGGFDDDVTFVIAERGR